ncbi:MAG TPA: chemotaxis protein CheA, partial [Thioploca sp.]|nr:chemotaxis protein CheA [Thioploca sp.]
MEEKMANQEDFTTIFIEEAHEHLPTIESSLLKLEKNPQDREQLDLLFRSVHTIKGGAGFVGLNKVGSLAHSMENLLGQVRASEIVLERDHIDALLAGYDRLAQMLDDPSDSEEIDITEEYQRLESLRSLPPSTIQPVDKAAEQAETSSAPTAPSAPQVTDNTTAQNVVKKIAADSDTSYLYEVHLFLNNDLPKIDKSLSQYIEALETDGTIVDSYLDVENRVSLEDRVKGELSFVFLFATDMALDSVTAVLGVPQSQIASSSIDSFKPKYEEKPETRLVNPDEPSQVITEPLDTVPIGEPEIPPNPPLPKGGTPPFRKGGQGEFLPSVSENPAFPKQSQHPSTETEDSIRVHVKRLNKLVDLAGELVLARNQIFRVSETFSSQLTGLKGILHNLNRITTEIQEEIMNTRMQPVGIIFSKFPRLIRQLAADLGKNIELVTEGNDVELDKTIIESLSDPMTHIIRNIADHGIEPPEERQQKGKLPTGLLLQKAFHKSGQVIIQVSDDGRGIDPDGIARKAVEKGFITQEAMLKMTHKEKINLIFTPGLSTAKNVSSVSGRGVGMDVVKSNVEQIGGTIDVTSFVDKGTTLTMTLPLTMAIISGLIVQTRNCWFAFPQVNMEEMVMLHAEEHATKIGQIQGQTVLRLRGKLLPLMSLEKGLNFPSDSSGPDEIPEKNNTHDTMHILIVKSETHRVAIIVDKILGNEEIVVKPIPEYLKHIKSFSGTTILGDGAI